MRGLSSFYPSGATLSGRFEPTVVSYPNAVDSYPSLSLFAPKPLIDSYLEGKNRSVNVYLKYLTRERMGR